MLQKSDHDTTIDEIHQIREQLAAKFNYDLQAIQDDVRRRQSASNWPVWHPATSDNSQSSISGSENESPVE